MKIVKYGSRMTIPSCETEATVKEEKIQKAFEIMLAKSSVQREEAMKEIAARYEEMERSGELYVTTCEIIFPPQAAEKHRLGGVVVEIGTVLSWLADNCQTENPQHASLLREIAEEFYPEDEDDGYDEDDFVLSGDVAEKLESVLSGPHAIVEEIS